MKILTSASSLIPLLALLAGFNLFARWRMRRASLMTDGPRPLENLLPLAAYDSDETGYWSRMGYVAGVSFGTAMGVCALVGVALFEGQLALLDAAVGGAVAGLWFGLGFRLMMRGVARVAIARLYTKRPSIADAPPDRQVRYQILCTCLHAKSFAGGVLYFGCGGLFFAPQKRSRGSFLPFEITQMRGIEITLVESRPGNTLQRLLVARPLKMVRISANGVSAHLSVPCPNAAADAIRRCLAALQDSPS